MGTSVIALAVLPSIALLIYVYNKDKTKEPPSLLIKLFFIGAATCIPAAILEVLFGNVLDLFFDSPTEGQLSFYIYAFIEYFFGVALIEEGVKWVAMLLITKNNKEFNSLFDGFVYAIFVSLGFATLENILYVAEGGLSTALLRAVTSIPGHMFFAVFMGYYYSEYHKKELASRMEKYYSSTGLIRFRSPKISYTLPAILSLALPTLVHGFYDFCLSVEIPFLVIVDLGFMIMLYIVCFKQINKASKYDAPDTTAAVGLIYAKYPEFLEYARQQAFKATQSYYQSVQARPIYQSFRPSHYQNLTPAQPAQPTYQQPVQQATQPVYQQPVQAAQPTYQQPVNQQPQTAQPVYQQQYNQGYQQPVYQQQVYQGYNYQQYQNPVQQPTQQSYQQANNYYNVAPTQPVQQQPATNQYSSLNPINNQQNMQ